MSHSKRTWHFAVFSMVIICLLYGASFLERSPSFQLDDVLGFLIILLITCAVLGIYSGLRAITEPANPLKWIGLSMNIIIAVGIVSYLTM